MKNTLVIVLLISVLASCWSYKRIEEVYPNHFDFAVDKVSHDNLPEDIFISLPGEFRLANQLGYMTTFIYPDAFVGFKENKQGFKKRKLITSSLLKQKLTELTNAGYSVYAPIQFPHVICFYPTEVDLVERFEKEASIDLIMSLNLIHNNDSTLELLDNEIKGLKDATEIEKNRSTALTNLIQLKLNEEQQWILRNKELEKKMKELDVQIQLQRSSPKSVGLDKTMSENLFSYVDITGTPITTKNDPFRQAHYDQQVDISNKPYNTSRTSRDGYPTLDAEMVAAMDKFHSSMKNPRGALQSEGFTEGELADLEAWSKDPSNDIQITSASRSPVHQLNVPNPQKAGTLNSKHLLGVAVDVKLPGKIYDPSKNKKAYDLMRKVALATGINFSLPNNPVETMHAVLASYQDGNAANKASYCGKLADLLSAYNSGISGELSNQEGQSESKNNTKGALSDGLNDLKGEIESKLSQVNTINGRISSLQKQHGIFSEQLQQKSNELCSIIAAKNRNNNSGRHEREPNRRDPRSNTTEKPREGPREKPQRERSREIGRSREIRPT